MGMTNSDTQNLSFVLCTHNSQSPQQGIPNILTDVITKDAAYI